MPLWLPETDKPLQETIEDTLEWARTRPPGHEWQAGLPAEREQELLAAFDASR
jgi:hypothetical protein